MQTKFSDWLRTKMWDKGWSQEELAKEMNVSLSSISTWRNPGHHRYATPSAPNLYRLCEIFEISPEDMADIVQSPGILREMRKIASAGAPQGKSYVNLRRLKELKAINSSAYDLTKLVRLCEEINICYLAQSYFAVAMLVRAILDHVPPIFECTRFAEVASNYGEGGKSFSASMKHLENSSRKIADTHLHNQVRKKESLPNETQVNFSNDLDVLLSEIVRVL